MAAAGGINRVSSPIGMPGRGSGGMGEDGMRLHVARAVGRGATALAAFDAALVAAGVANYNLIRLSSVIPAHAEVVDVERCPYTDLGRWGDRLYAVYAEQRATSPGEHAWAGIGWVQDPVSGRGLFVEHEGTCEGDVRDQIAASLNDLQASRDLDLGPIQTRVIGATCVGSATCALVICAYAVESWRSKLVDGWPELAYR